MTVLAAHPWRSNAELIEACAQLDYLAAAVVRPEPTLFQGCTA